MNRVHVTLIDAAGQTLQASAKPGRSVMRAAVDAGVDGIAADCGGSLSCATCHVYVDAVWLDRLPVPTAEEMQMLEMTAAERRSNSRLSCQLELQPALDGLVVHLPPNQY
jgi:ferredoxin, 2Fe-2S